MQLSLSTFLLVASVALAQQAVPPAFEVASIKLSDEPPGHSGGHTRPGSLRFQNRTLKDCIMAAYNVRSFQVIGGPNWTDSERYNIDAKAPGPAGDDDLMSMVRTLLADRFQLSFHRETRSDRGYAMVLAKGGLKIKPSEAEGDASTHTTRVSLSAVRIPMERLASFIAERLAVPVADETGVAGAYDIELKWAAEEENSRAAGEKRNPAEVRNSAEVPRAIGPPLPEALQQQLGLKLEARKMPVEVLVIDRAEKPTEN